MGKTFVIGDIHGAHKALIQCLERSEFNKKEDTLIQLGDVADGWNEVYECVEELLTIPNLISIKGNHDDWFLEFIETNIHGSTWNQGGVGTLMSYCKKLNKKYLKHSWGYMTSMLGIDIPEEHKSFFRNQLNYYLHNNKLFVHGGFNRHFKINEQQVNDIYWWDRDLWYGALSFKTINDLYKFKTKDNFEEIYIGHTSTMMWKKDTPMKAANIYNLDTGAGFNGKLTIMDIDTKEYFQSDNVKELYPNQIGRN